MANHSNAHALSIDLSLLFIGIALPIEILITVLFWGLFLYNPALLLSKKAVEAG